VLPQQVDQAAEREALAYNKRVYAAYYRNPLLMVRYDLLYRERRIARLLREAGVELGRGGFRAFEYGFGAGHLLRVVARASQVVGMEGSPSAVEHARALMPAAHPHWQMSEWSDATRLPVPDGAFDLVTASHVLEHLPDDDAALDEWLRILSPGGHLLILLPSNEQLFAGSKHLRLYDRQQFAARLRARGLREVQVDEHQRFDRPFKHHRLVLFSRKGPVAKLLVDGPKTLLFLLPQLVSWRLLSGLDRVLSVFSAPSSSIAYLFQKPE
jgi:ubiquinone/menaquinone biosynthesis C-methylase UbiE